MEPFSGVVKKFSDLLRPSEGASASSRVQYTCIDVVHPFLACGSNSGVVDIYDFESSGHGVCRLIKTLAPPRKSKQVNVKVTCVSLDPTARLLAVGNILGHVSVVLLSLQPSEPQGGPNSTTGGTRAHKVVYGHTAHKESVRCLVWDAQGARLFSGCDGGVVVETALPSDHVDELSGVKSSEQDGGGTSRLGGALGGLGLGGAAAAAVLSAKPLVGGLTRFFQGPSHSVFSQDDSEVLQLQHVRFSEESEICVGTTEGPPECALVVTHATRCSVFIMDQGSSKQPFCIQVEGDPSVSGTRTLHGAALVVSTSRGGSGSRACLYVSRPMGTLWVVDLGSSAVVANLAPAMERVEGAFNGGRVFPVLCRPVEAGLLGGLVAWTPGHDVAFISADGQQAQRLFEHAVHGLSAWQADTGTMRLFVLYGHEKAVGVLDVTVGAVWPKLSIMQEATPAEIAASIIQRAWRVRRGSSGLVSHATGKGSVSEHLCASGSPIAATAGDNVGLRAEVTSTGPKSATCLIHPSVPPSRLDPAPYRELRVRRSCRQKSVDDDGAWVALEEGFEEASDALCRAVDGLARLEYQVTLRPGGGGGIMGLDMGLRALPTGEECLMVYRVTPLPDGSPSPAQLCGAVEPGDILVAVDGLSLAGLPLDKKVALVLKLGRGSSHDEVVLRFQRGAVGDVGEGLEREVSCEGQADASSSNPFASMLTDLGDDALQAASQYLRDSRSLPGAVLSEDQQQFLGAMFDLGLASGDSSGGSGDGHTWTGPARTAVLQLKSKLFPWKKPVDTSAEGDAEAAAQVKGWGRFERGEVKVGFVIPSEELHNELNAIASDVQEVLVTISTARHPRFYDDEHFPESVRCPSGQLFEVEEGCVDPPLHPEPATLGDLLYLRSLLRGGGRSEHYFTRQPDMEVCDSMSSDGDDDLHGPSHDKDDVEGDGYGGADGGAAGGAVGVAGLEVLAETAPLEQLARWHVEFMGPMASSRAHPSTSLEMVNDLEAVTDALSHMLGEAVPSREARSWPPVHLTFLTSYVLSVQHGHAVVTASETILQEWLRGFTPLSPAQKHLLREEGAGFIGPHTAPEDVEIERENRRLTSNMLTLFFQMHTVWPLFQWRSEVGQDQQQDSEGDAWLSWGPSSVDPLLGIIVGTGLVRGPGRPTQWSEEEALAFLEEYGAYVWVDGIVRACLARGFERALQWVLDDLAPRETAFSKGLDAVRDIIEKSAGSQADNVSQRILGAVNNSEQPLTTLVAALPRLVEACPESLPPVAHECFPDLRPWLIKTILQRHLPDPDRDFGPLWTRYWDALATRERFGKAGFGRYAEELPLERSSMISRADSASAAGQELSACEMSEPVEATVRTLAADDSGHLKGRLSSVDLPGGGTDGAAAGDILHASLLVEAAPVMAPSIQQGGPGGMAKGGAERHRGHAAPAKRRSLRTAARQHVRRMQQKVIAQSVFLQAKVNMWRRQGDGGVYQWDVTHNFVPPGYLGLAHLEARLSPSETSPDGPYHVTSSRALTGSANSSIGRRNSVGSMLEEDGGETPSKRGIDWALLGDPMHGFCGMGLPRDAIQECAGCRLPVASFTHASTRQGTRRREAEATSAGYVAYSCGHSYHSYCNFERACTACQTVSFPFF